MGGQTVSENVQYSTVEDLSLDKMVELFLQGNLTVEELEKGLKSKGIVNFQKQENDGVITVTFKIKLESGYVKEYTLNCNGDDAKSQTDQDYQTLTKVYVDTLAGKYCLTTELFNKYFTRVDGKIDQGYDSTEDVITYIINNHMTLEEVINDIEQNYTITNDGTYSQDILYSFGISSEYYLNKYFEKDETGNYKLKVPSVVDGKEINSIVDLKDALHLQSYDEFIKNYPGMNGSNAKNLYTAYEKTNVENSMIKANGYGSIAEFFMDFSKSYEGASNVGINIGDKNLILDKYTKDSYFDFADSYCNVDGVICCLTDAKNTSKTFCYADYVGKDLKNQLAFDAICKLVGITDSDSLEQCNNKFQHYIDDHAWYEIFEDLYSQGLIAEKAEDNPEPETIDEEFYNNLGRN